MYEGMKKVGKSIKINEKLSIQRYKHESGEQVIEFNHAHVTDPMLIKIETLQEVYKKLDKCMKL